MVMKEKNQSNTIYSLKIKRSSQWKKINFSFFSLKKKKIRSIKNSSKNNQDFNKSKKSNQSFKSSKKRKQIPKYSLPLYRKFKQKTTQKAFFFYFYQKHALIRFFSFSLCFLLAKKKRKKN